MVRLPPHAVALVCLVAIAIATAPARAAILIDDFDDVSDWSGLTLDSSMSVDGVACGRWSDHVTTTSARKTFALPADASDETLLTFWLWSATANGALIELIFDSENAVAGVDWDYYRHQIIVDWTGWRRFAVRLRDFVVARQPLGWDTLNYVVLSADGWGHVPLADTDLCLDRMEFPSAVVDDFDDVSDWSNLVGDAVLAVEGSGCGRWSDQVADAGVRKSFVLPFDATGYDRLSFWLWSADANGALIELIFDSENPINGTDWDYFRYQIVVDWVGWRRFVLPLSAFSTARSPVGWNELNSAQLSAAGWGHVPLATTDLCLDEMRFDVGVITAVRSTYGFVGVDYRYDNTIDLVGSRGRSTLDLSLVPGPGFAFAQSLSANMVTLDAGQGASVTVAITIPPSEIRADTYLDRYTLDFEVTQAAELVDATALSAAVPLPQGPSPRLLLDAADFARIADWTGRFSWASHPPDVIVAAPDTRPQAYMTKYAQTPTWSLPPEGGQWTAWYTCPVHGVRLVFGGLGDNRCPIDDANYTGWPYDQVIYAWQHNELARAARDTALAFRLTGDLTYAQEAAAILSAYADVYTSYPIHNINGVPATSGGRVLSQTLDESGFAIPMAWAYDLIRDTTALDDPARAHIEDDLLRPLAETIARHRAGASNWQSWHNAAIGAVGFALADPRLQGLPINGPDGFFFQMANSVDGDGFWYEGSWGYHFYALDPLVQLAEMARHAGLDLYSQPALRSMFEAPMLFAMPSRQLPPFNDSGIVTLTSYDRLYEIAYGRWGDPGLATVLGKRARGRNALFWGGETIPTVSASSLSSAVFPSAGYAVLRPSRPADPMYVAIDFGPHGGGHGHRDKLGFVLFARDRLLAIDPGTQSYAAPTHTTWDKETVAHNTLVVDETTQAETTGALHRFVSVPTLAAVRADAGDAYANGGTRSVDLIRTMIAAPEYVIDLFDARALDGTSHRLDWVLHCAGAVATPLVVAPYAAFPATDGYQHLVNTMAATTSAPWDARFDLGLGAWGSVWNADPANAGASLISAAQAHGGSYSGELTYDFATASSYMLFSSPPPPEVPEVPLALSLWLYGDGSSHGLALRLYDQSGERFVFEAGVIDFVGWQEIRGVDVATWTHYLGNDDGVIDLPLTGIAVQISYQGGATQSAIYVDDIALEYAAAGIVVVEDFEGYRAGVSVMALAEAGTTVVTGEGLGPDLTAPVPFVMARRQGTATTFVALLEPYSDLPTVTAFEQLSTTAPPTDEAAGFRVTTSAHEDRIAFVGSGPGGVLRSFGPLACNGQLCSQRLAAGTTERMVLVAGTQLAADGTVLVDATATLDGLQVDVGTTTVVVWSAAALAGELRIHAPAPSVQTVEVNGAPVAFTREGEYVVLGGSIMADGSPLADGGPRGDSASPGDGFAPGDEHTTQDGGGVGDGETQTSIGGDTANGVDDPQSVARGCACSSFAGGDSPPLSQRAGSLLWLLVASLAWRRRFRI